MGITYSIALFPELAPSSLRQIECAVKYARLLRHRGGERIIIRGRSTAKITRVAELSKALQDEGFSFDEYVTEWNPYRWGQPAEVIVPMLRKARSLTNGTLSHASTVTTRHGTLLSETQLSDLFKAILREGATPWLSVYFNRTALDQVYEAYCRAQLSLS